MKLRGPTRIGFALAVLAFLSAGPAAADGPMEAALDQFESCNYPAAIQTLQAARAKAPSDARVFYWISRSYYELRDYDNAINYGDAAVRLDENNSEYWFWLGRANGGKADRERSLHWARKTKSAFERAVELDPKNIPARRALIEYLTEAPAFLAGGSDSKARENIQTLVSQDPVQGNLAWGYYWDEEKEYDKADAAYRQALSLKPRETEPYFEAANYYRRRGDTARMEAVLEAAAKVDASDVRLNFYRGVVRTMAGNRLGEAERDLKAYLEKICPRSDDPSPASAHEWLGKLYEQMGKRPEAIQQYRKALTLDPKRKIAREGLNRLEQ